MEICSKADEVGLISRICNGDMDAFESMYLQHKRRVYAWSLRLLSDPAEAEDTMQDVFIHARKYIGSFRGNCRLSTWLHQVTFSIFLQKIRKKRISVVSLDQLRTPDDGVPFEPATTDRQLEFSIDRVVLNRARSLLTANRRQVLDLHSEGYEHKEIATLLGVTVAASKSSLHGARLSLRRSLGGPAVQEHSRLKTASSL
jgi:RNA polymerase sigma-70 factor (ECF subfamily)